MAHDQKLVDPKVINFIAQVSLSYCHTQIIIYKVYM